MTARTELACLLREQLLQRIPEPTPQEAEIIDVTVAYASFAPALFAAPYTRRTLEMLDDLSQTLAVSLQLLGPARLAGSRLEHYVATATHMADVTRLMIERPAGRA